MSGSVTVAKSAGFCFGVQRAVDTVLEEALAFKNTSKQAARIHCATIGWDAVKQLLEEGK